MSVEIVKDALEYYDFNNEKYKHLKKKMKYIEKVKKTHNGIEGREYVFYDRNKKEIFRSRVEILAKYYTTLNVWIWGWGLPNIPKSHATIIRKVFLYGTDIHVDERKMDAMMLKNELVTSRFKIVNDIQLDIHCALASYLAKKPFVFIFKDLLDIEGIARIKGEFYKKETNVRYYMFIVDTPDDSVDLTPEIK
ncbi:MAG: hypothetical protein Dasosvirus16_2 [Dasosvirus sp.]|uniref:Uncharacterized protein n=1 Tax=Dasosvirus sp. TaxID=2487764 RepID=A0A3G4ZRY3_9VIRU|nr:MAG: hypothetical protein Dasosvirus16_2 [Dasosvirus sp.]